MIDVSIPTHCPKCKDALLNEYYEDKTGKYFRKHCKTKLSHKFQCAFEDDAEYLAHATIAISVDPLIRVSWNFKKELLEIAHGTLEDIVRRNMELETIPFFVPDFSDYDGLIRKVKLYITFS